MRKLQHDEIDRLSLDEFRRADKHPVVAVLEDVRSIYNVGSIFRTADATAVQGLVLTGITGTPENPAIRKSSLGAEAVVSWRREADVASALESLRADGFSVAALELTDRPTRIDELRMDDYPLALVVGNEVSGVSQAVIDRADFAIEIPQFGTKQSLNVAVAFGIATFGIVARWRRLAGVDA